MRSGRRDERILVEMPLETVNAYGEKIVTWTEFARLWANVSAEKGRQYFADSQTNNTNPEQITINYNNNISDKYRIEHDGRYFEIENVTHYRRRNETKIICSEIT